MAYELHINATTAGGPSIDAAAASTGKLAGTTSRLNDVLYGAGAAQEKFTLGTQKLAIEQAKIEALTLQYRNALLGQTSATEAAAVGQNALATATQRTVSSTMAAGTAMRVMEGAMPIRAAANFLGSLQGIGPALQLAFPIFGAVALIGVLDTIIEKTEKWVNAHDPVIQAQKMSLSLLKQEGQEYDRLAKKAQEYSDKKLEAQFGKGLVDRLQSRRYSTKAGQEDQDEIDKLQRIQSALNRLGQVADVGGGNVTTLRQAPMSESDRRIAGTLRQVLGDDPKFKDQLSGLEAMGSGGRTRPDVSQAQAAGELSVGINAAISRAEMQQKVDLGESADKLADANKDAAEKAKSATAKRAAAAAKLEADEARVVSAVNAAADKLETALGGDRFLSDIARNAQRTQADILKDPKNAARYQAAGNDSELALIIEKQRKLNDEQSKLDKSDFELALKVGKLAEEQWNDVYKTLEKGGAPVLKFVTGLREAALSYEEDVLKNQRNTDRKQMGQIGLRNRLAGAPEGSDAADSYNLRISQADREYAQRMKIEDLQKTIDDHAEARKKLLADKDQEIFDAQMDRENAMLEMAVKQKDAFQSAAVGFLNAGRSGGGAGLSKFMMGELGGIEDKVVGNAAGMVWPVIQKAMGGLHAQGGTTLGNLLQGTPFGPDPMKTAGITLNTAGEKLIVAAQALTSSGGGGSAGGAGGAAVRAALGMGSKGANAWGDGGSTTTIEMGPGGGPGELGDWSGGISVPLAKSGMSATGRSVGIAGAAAAGAFGVYSGIHAGGAQGALTASGSAIGAAASILTLALPKLMSTLGPVGMAAGMALGLVSMLIGDPKAKREEQIQRELKFNQFMAPVAINSSMTTGGTYADFDRFGGTRGSNISPFPTIEQGFFDYRHNTTVPGRTDSTFGGPGAQITVNVQTLDSKSFNENSHLVADALQHALQTGRGTGLQETLRHL